MSAFPGPQEFVALLTRLLSTDNTDRNAAEAHLKTLRTDPQNLVLSLLSTIGAHGTVNSPVRLMAVTVLRPTLVKSTETLWAAMSPQFQQQVKAELLRLLEADPDDNVRRKLCDTVSELGAFISDKGGWNELFPFMFHCTTSQAAAVRESAMSIFAQLAILLGPLAFRPNFSIILKVLQTGLSDPTSLDVRLAALAATSAFLQVRDFTCASPFPSLNFPCMPTQPILLKIMEKQDEDTVNVFRGLIPNMLECISAALGQKKEEEAQAALEVFVELAETQPLFFKPHIASIVSAMFQLARSEQFSNETRRYALEVMVTLCEHKPVMVK